jgi:hypothetical protein
MSIFRVTGSNVPVVQESKAIEAAQQTEAPAAGPVEVNQPNVNEAPQESRSINGGTQTAEAFLAGTLVQANLHSQLDQAALQEPQTPAACPSEVQQSVPIVSEAQSIMIEERPAALQEIVTPE